MSCRTNVVNSIPNQPVWLEKYYTSHKTCIFNPLEMYRFRYWGVSARFDNFGKFRCACSRYNHFGQDRYKLKWDFVLVCTNCFAPRQIVGQPCLKLQLAGPSTTCSCFQLAEPIVTTESFFFCSLVCSASSVFVFYA